METTPNQTVEPTEPVDTTESMPDTPCPRVRAWHVIVLVVGVLAASAALGLMLTASSDRDDATAAHKQAARALVDEKAQLHQAENELDAERTHADTLVSPAEFALSWADGLLGVANQQVAESQTAQRLGGDEAASVDEYNASVDRNNALVDQYNAKIDELNRLIDDVGNAVNA